MMKEKKDIFESVCVVCICFVDDTKSTNLSLFIISTNAPLKNSKEYITRMVNLHFETTAYKYCIV